MLIFLRGRLSSQDDEKERAQTYFRDIAEAKEVLCDEGLDSNSDSRDNPPPHYRGDMDRIIPHNPTWFRVICFSAEIQRLWDRLPNFCRILYHYLDHFFPRILWQLLLSIAYWGNAHCISLQVPQNPGVSDLFTDLAGTPKMRTGAISQPFLFKTTKNGKSPNCLEMGWNEIAPKSSKSFEFGWRMAD